MIESTTELNEASAYLNDIDAPAPIVERVRTLLDAYARVVELGASDIFVSEDIDEEGNRTFTSLWIFTVGAAYEAKLSDEGGDQLDGTALRNYVLHWVVRTQEFDFKAAWPSSRAALEVWFSDEFLGEMRATGINCLRLAEILKKYVAANWRQGG